MCDARLERTVARGRAVTDPIAELLALNPWMKPLWDARQTGSPDWLETVSDARYAAATQRLAAGRAAWNDWADAMEAVQEEIDAMPWGEDRDAAWRLFSPCSGVDFWRLPVDAPLDFSGFKFGYVAFSRRHKDAEGWRRQGVRFRAEVDFSGARLAADFTGCVFEGAANFQGVEAGYLKFSEARFKNAACFAGARFTNNDGIWFDRARFEGFSNFSGVVAQCKFDFYGATFVGDADFSNLVLLDPEIEKSEANFMTTTFEGRASFRRARVERQSLAFAGATFRGPADFSEMTVKDAGCRFGPGTADATPTVFQDMANFQGFDVDEGLASFSHVRFLGPLDVSGADFTYPGTIEAADITGPIIGETRDAQRRS